MNRIWREPLLLMLIGLASIGVVLSVRQLLLRPGQGSAPRSEGNDAALRKQMEDSKKQIRLLEQRLKETETKLETLESPKATEGARPALDSRDAALNGEIGPTAQGRVGYQEALAHAWEYLQMGRFDSVVHEKILADLDEAYAVTGLPPEANSSLVSAIKRVNDRGVEAVIGKSQALSIEDANKLLRAFLDTTPRLSAQQADRIKAALRRHSSQLK